MDIRCVALAKSLNRNAAILRPVGQSFNGLEMSNFESARTKTSSTPLQLLDHLSIAPASELLSMGMDHGNRFQVQT